MMNAILRTTIAAGVGLVYGDLETIQSALKTLATSRNRTNAIGPLRGASFTPFFESQVQDIVNSGCWCFFGDDHALAKGPYVNNVDKFCQALHHGYDCAIMDSGDDCLPWHVSYVPSSGMGTHDQSMTMFEECVYNNGGENCASRACAVETRFVNDIFEFIQEAFDWGSGNDAIFDQSVRHENGFSHEDNCAPLKQGGSGGNGSTRPKTTLQTKEETQCCGTYPHRFPYKVNAGTRACCMGKTYDTHIYGCCGGQIESDLNC